MYVRDQYAKSTQYHGQHRIKYFNKFHFRLRMQVQFTNCTNKYKTILFIFWT